MVTTSAEGEQYRQRGGGGGVVRFEYLNDAVVLGALVGCCNMDIEHISLVNINPSVSEIPIL